MSNEQKPGDPADKAADGAFGGVQSHRAGYGDDKLQRLTEWLRAHPTATLASGEGALLLAQIDRLTVELGKGALRLEIEMLTVERDRAEAERDEEIARVVRITERLGAETLRAERAERILAAVREPSEAVLEAAGKAFWGDKLLRRHLRAAVAAAEREVGG